jgi:hypothetical protein
MPGFWESKSSYKSSQKFTRAQPSAEAEKSHFSSSFVHAPQFLVQDIASPSPPRVAGTALAAKTVDSTMQPSVDTTIQRGAVVAGSFPPAPPSGQPAAAKAVSPQQPGMLTTATQHAVAIPGIQTLMFPARVSEVGCGTDLPAVTPKAPPQLLTDMQPPTVDGPTSIVVAVAGAQVTNDLSLPSIGGNPVTTRIGDGIFTPFSLAIQRG